ncbi:uncharacterized protein LOC134833426 [Culicoides brevitarsis]|uniref:uncharacterized protein LOC134833426 n=1 Tax=Culicoides brevitarsis TaxID=469753 RepID=UPI00307BABD2
MFSRQKSSFKPFQALANGFNGNFHCDVEIRTQGGWKINAHSFYLASCSKFLQKCLENVRPGTVPTIYLPDVKPSVVQALLQFIYTGETNLHKDDIEEFYSIGKCLQMDAINEVSEHSCIPRPPISTNLTNLSYQRPIEEGELMQDDPLDDVDDDSNDAEMLDEPNDVTLCADGVKKHQIVCRQNLPYFKTKLQASIATLYSSFDINMEVNFKVELNTDPLSVKSSTKCPICRKSFNLYARLDRQRNRFIQWNTSKYRLHFKQKHSRTPEALPPTENYDCDIVKVEMDEFGT